ncbi:MAG: glycosyltransferase, partial [Candidatus Eisenbacteria bacterium]|nr:glycosyltransferase [Candidatus Eisenbacteria bacterium]
MTPPLGKPRALTVVVPVRDAAPTIRRFLETLEARLHFLRDEGVETLVVDDESADDTAREVLAFGRARPDLLLLRNPGRLGPGAAARHGILLAGGGSVLLASPSFPLPVGLLEEMVVERERGADVVLGSLEPDVRRALRPLLIRREVFRRLGRRAPAQPAAAPPPFLHLYAHRTAVEIYSRQRIEGEAFLAETLYLVRRFRYRAVEIGAASEREPRETLELGRSDEREARAH